ncbi:hypothetical protein [Flavobacterium sp. I3-2]|uniref:hypothetical protein n=1 Tax=Flavobacterium sp. I3-2 TaxID=2748319 RepID=UPI0015ACB5D2|nr:hypothetical protein [Flavobacterium sp. I3-2]
MKYILGIVATCLMIWSLLDKENQEYKVYVQVVAVALFFFVMMRLMDKMPSKNEESNEDDNFKEKDEDDKERME